MKASPWPSMARSTKTRSSSRSSPTARFISFRRSRAAAPLLPKSSAARVPGRVATGGGVRSGGVGPPKPARRPEGGESGERVTQHERTPPSDDGTRPPRAPNARECSGLEAIPEPRIETVAQAVAHDVDGEHGGGEEDAREQDIVREYTEERTPFGHDVAPGGRLRRDPHPEER